MFKVHGGTSEVESTEGVGFYYSITKLLNKRYETIHKNIAAFVAACLY